MLFALDSNLNRVRAGEAEPPYYCPSCAREVQQGRTGNIKVFLHSDPSCESEHPCIETSKFREDVVARIDDDCVDVVVGEKIAAARFPDIDVILEPRSSRITGQDVIDIVEEWNRVGMAPLFVWCAPTYANFRMKARELHLLASVAESKIIENLNKADYPYVVWENGQLFGMRIYSAKERFYFGVTEPIELNRVKPMVFETIYGNIAGLDAVEASQTKL